MVAGNNLHAGKNSNPVNYPEHGRMLAHVTQIGVMVGGKLAFYNAGSTEGIIRFLPSTNTTEGRWFFTSSLVS